MLAARRWRYRRICAIRFGQKGGVIMAEDDLVYLLRRSAEERTRAQTATENCVRIAHRELARGYEIRLRQQADFEAPRAATII